MVKVFLDIAGFYYDIEVDVGSNATVKDVMDAAVEKGDNGRGASLTYSVDGTGSKANVDRITVIHSKGSAVSRQQPTIPGQARRFYGNGIYSLADDALIFDGQFIAADPNKRFVHAWQYYIYDNIGVDLARKRGLEGQRKIVSFGDTVDKDYDLLEGFTVVWRLVAIMIGANYNSLGDIPANNVQPRLKIVQNETE